MTVLALAESDFRARYRILGSRGIKGAPAKGNAHIMWETSMNDRHESTQKLPTEAPNRRRVPRRDFLASGGATTIGVGLAGELHPALAVGQAPKKVRLGIAGGNFGEVDILEIGGKDGAAQGLQRRKIHCVLHFSDANGRKGIHDAWFDAPVDLNRDVHLYRISVGGIELLTGRTSGLPPVRRLALCEFLVRRRNPTDCLSVNLQRDDQRRPGRQSDRLCLARNNEVRPAFFNRERTAPQR